MQCGGMKFVDYNKLSKKDANLKSASLFFVIV